MFLVGEAPRRCACHPRQNALDADDELPAAAYAIHVLPGWAALPTGDGGRRPVRDASHWAGLERRGAHRLRHSLATEMLRAGASRRR
jgi:integrase